MKMPDCYAKGCRSRGTQCRKNKKQLEWEESHGKISFHRIPKDPSERKKWIDGMGLEYCNVPGIAALCSLHFHEKDLDRTSLSCTRLYPGAVPSAFVSENTKKGGLFFDHYKVDIEHSYHKQKTADDRSDQQILHNIEAALDNDNGLPQQCSGVSDTPDIPSTSNVSQEDSCASPMRTFTSQGTSVSPRLSDNTHRKKILQNALNHTRITYRKKIRMLQQKQRRTMKYIAKLKDVLGALQKENLLEAE